MIKHESGPLQGTERHGEGPEDTLHLYRRQSQVAVIPAFRVIQAPESSKGPDEQGKRATFSDEAFL